MPDDTETHDGSPPTPPQTPRARPRAQSLPPLRRRSATFPASDKRGGDTFPTPTAPRPRSSTFPAVTPPPRRELDLGFPRGDLIDDEAEAEIETDDLDLDEEDTYDEYGFPEQRERCECGCGGNHYADMVDLELLARRVYALLLRETLVERERLGPR
jgi:hypothetical protein